MFENPMPEDVDAQAAELDFENQPEPAEPQPAAPQPAYQPAAPQYEPEPQQPAAQEPEYSQAELYEWLSEVAETDPLQAADFLARAHAQQMQEAMEERLAPMVGEYHERQAASITEALAQQYGEAFNDETKAALAAHLDADPEFYVDANGQLRPERLGLVLDSIIHRGGPQPVDPDAAAIEAIGEFAPSAQGQDRFGAQGGPSAGASRPSVGSVFVEGGSTPPPPARPPMTVDDAIKAEIDFAAEGVGRDAFGKRQAHIRR